MAARLGARRGGERLGLVDLAQHVAHAAQVELAGVGEREAARRAVDEPRAEVILEVGDEPGDDGGRQIEDARSRGEAALVDDAREDPHRVQAIHGHAFIVSFPVTK